MGNGPPRPKAWATPGKRGRKAWDAKLSHPAQTRICQGVDTTDQAGSLEELGALGVSRPSPNVMCETPGTVPAELAIRSSHAFFPAHMVIKPARFNVNRERGDKNPTTDQVIRQARKKANQDQSPTTNWSRPYLIAPNAKRECRTRSFVTFPGDAKKFGWQPKRMKNFPSANEPAYSWSHAESGVGRRTYKPESRRP